MTFPIQSILLQSQVNMLDGLIAILIGLVILSIITEKLGTLVRSYPVQMRYLIFGLSLSLLWVLWYSSDELFKDKISGFEHLPIWYTLPFVVVVLRWKPRKVTALERLSVQLLHDLKSLKSFNANWLLELKGGLDPLLNWLFWTEIDSEDDEVKAKSKTTLNFIKSAVFTLLSIYIINHIFAEGKNLQTDIIQVSVLHGVLMSFLILSIRALLYKDVFTNIKKGETKDIKAKKDEITFLSLVIGLLVAFCFKASIINMFQQAFDPSANFEFQYGWDDKFFLYFKNGYFHFREISIGKWDLLGIGITGFFLSFGSQFFHDILENLLEIKNLKRKLSDKETYKVTSIKELDEHLKLRESDMVKSVYDKHSDDLMSIDGVVSVTMGSFQQANEEVRGIKILAVKDVDVNPEKLFYELPNGNARLIPIKVERLEDGDDFEVTTSIYPSDLIEREKQASEGTYCLPVIDKYSKEEYLLTCYHVVKQNGHDWSKFEDPGDTTAEVSVKLSGSGTGSVSGRIHKGKVDSRVDSALVKLGTDSQYILESQSNKHNIKVTSARRVFSLDDDRTKVNVYGATTDKLRKGIITGVGTIAEIKYSDGSQFELRDLFEIEKNGKTIVQKGDSGALVFTNGGVALGMIVATNSKKALAIPITTVFSEMKVKPKFN